MTETPTPPGYSAPHQTREPWPFLVTDHGEPTVIGVEACLVGSDAADPEDDDPRWHAAIVIGNRTHVLVAGLPAGWYRVWVAVTRGDYRIVDRTDQTIRLY